MPRKSYKPEEIVAKLRQVDVLISRGQSVAEAIRSIGVSEVTYYRWRQEFGGLKSDQIKRLKELETENTRLRRAVSDLTLDKLILQEGPGETTKPRAPPRLHRACSRRAVDLRAACLRRSRSASLDAAQDPVGPSRRRTAETNIIELARQYGRYGYRKIAELLRRAGWLVNDKRVERIWRREGLKVPARQPKRARLWLNDGSCMRLRAERPNHVWSPAFAGAGSTTSSRNAPMRDANFACSTSSTSSLTSAWPFGYPAGSNRSTSSTYYRICSSCAAFPSTFAPTTGQSSLPRRCRNGSAPSGLRPLTSRPAARGRTALSKASTRACATSCSMARSSTPCARRRSSSRAGVVTTIGFARTPRSATGRRPRKCSFP